MMKKNGFTLAEVLITLTIIGVVATMTLPALMTNVGEQQARTGLKKGVNTLTEAVQMNQAIGGFDYKDFNAEGTAANMDAVLQEQSLRGLLMNRAQVDTAKSVVGLANGGTMNAGDAALVNSSAGMTTLAANRIVFFRDGSAIAYRAADTQSTPANNVNSTDGLPVGYNVIYDINGGKGPNRLSNCQGQSNATTDGAFTFQNDNYPTGATCNTRGNRIINDQFVLRLRGAFVSPGGDAAKWVMDN